MTDGNEPRHSAHLGHGPASWRGTRWDGGDAGRDRLDAGGRNGVRRIKWCVRIRRCDWRSGARVVVVQKVARCSERRYVPSPLNHHKKLFA